jgi:hypothetical protein
LICGNYAIVFDRFTRVGGIVALAIWAANGVLALLKALATGKRPCFRRCKE